MYAQQDAAGSTTSLAEVGGTVVARFLYNQDGAPEAMAENRTVLSAPWMADSPALPFRWQFLWHGGRWEGLDYTTSTTSPDGSTNDYRKTAGLYAFGAGGAWYDPRNGRGLQPDPQAYMNGWNGYYLRTLNQALDAEEADRQSHALVAAPQGGEAWIPVWAPLKGMVHDLSLIPYDYSSGHGLLVGGDIAGAFGNGIFAGLDAFGIGVLVRGGLRMLGRAGAAAIAREVAERETLAASTVPLAQGLERRLSQESLVALESGTLDYRVIAKQIRGVTRRSTLIADAIEDFRITAVLHDSHDQLRAAYELFGDVAPEGLKGFAREDVIHLVRDKSAFQTAVHEGIHALSWRAREYAEVSPAIALRDSVWEELQANGAEQQFLAALGVERSMTRYDILQHLWERPNYRSKFASATPQTHEFFRQWGIVK